MAQFSTLRGHADKAPRTTSLAEVHQATTDPMGLVARLTLLSRKARREGDDETARRLKAETGLYVPSAILEGGHAQECIRALTQQVLIDFDHIPPDRMDEVTNAIRHDPHTGFAHVTNSLLGIHIVVPWTCIEAPEPLAYDGTVPHADFLRVAQAFHAEAYDTVVRNYEALTSLKADPQTCNINRGAYYCYDPEAYYRAEAAPMVISLAGVQRRLKAMEQHTRASPAATTAHTPHHSSRVGNVFDFVEMCVQRHHTYVEGQRNAYISRCCYMLHDYQVPQDIILQWVDYRFPDFPQRERFSIVRSCCSRPSQLKSFKTAYGN